MRVELAVPLTLSEICLAASISPDTAGSELIKGISLDTRLLQDKDLFIALNGDNGSGEYHIRQALEKGAYVISSTNLAGVMHADNTSEALLNIAAFYKARAKIEHAIAVTGSVGKSTTVSFLKKILGSCRRVHSPLGNFNNHIGVPLTLLAMPKSTDVLISELGMNHTGEISRLSRCVRPTVGIITTVGTAHIGNLGSRKEIARAKLEIQDGMSDGTLLLPIDEPLLENITDALYIGCNSSTADFSLDKGTGDTYKLRSPLGDIDGIRFFDIREHILHNLAFAISASQLIGLTDDEIIRGVKTINEGDLRLRFITLEDFTIFDDSYNASLESVTADLRFISTLKRPTGAFLGDILELGEFTNDIHEKIGNEAGKLGIGKLYLYGKYAEAIARGAIDFGMKPDDIYINSEISSPEISVNHIKQYHKHGEIILFKASHKLRLDKIADLIKKEEMSNEWQ